MIDLIKEVDVEIDKQSKCDSIYLRRLTSHIERFKALIKDNDGEVELKIKDIKSLMGEEFKDKNINSFYAMLKLILIENGIKVKLHHNYGANVILSFAEANEIRPSIEISRERMIKTAKNAGYERYADYIRNFQLKKGRSKITMYDPTDKHYFVVVGRKYVSTIFPNAIINEYSMSTKFSVEKGGYDWISNGLKVKHIASTIRHKIDPPQEGRKKFERDLFQWLISNNDRADVFILTGWDNAESLDLMKAWIFKAHEIVNFKEFWNRSTFLISTSDRSILKYSEYEVDPIKLDLIREKILQDQLIELELVGDVVAFENSEEEITEIRKNVEKIRKENIENYYSTIFRTVLWNVKKEEEQ